MAHGDAGLGRLPVIFREDLPDGLDDFIQRRPAGELPQSRKVPIRFLVAQMPFLYAADKFWTPQNAGGDSSL